MQEVLSRPLRRREASEYLRACYGIPCAPATLAKYASVGGGPAFFKAGARCALYDRAELDRWAKERLGAALSSTSDAA